MAKAKSEDKSTTKSLAEIAVDISKMMNKNFGKQRAGDVTHILSAGGLTSPLSEATEFASTGSKILDIAISNRKNGGLPVGRLIEVYGGTQSGKSLLVASILAEVQKLGGYSTLFDAERAVDPAFLQAIGVNLETLQYTDQLTLEEMFQSIEATTTELRVKHEFKGIICFAIDSIHAARVGTKEAKTDKKDLYAVSGYNTAKPILLSEWLPRLINFIADNRVLLIFTNQLRQKLNAGLYEDPYITTGGKAIEFYASVRIYLKSKKYLKIERYGRKISIGKEIEALIHKTRNGPPDRVAQFRIYFDSGLDDYGSWLHNLNLYGVVTNNGAWYKFVDPTIYDKQFQGPALVEMLKTDSAFMDKVYDAYAKNVIMTYKLDKDFSYSEIQETNAVIDVSEEDATDEDE